MLNIILAALPALGSLIGSNKAGEVIAAGTKVAQEVFGTADERDIAKQISTNPALAEQFKARLDAETSALTAQLADVQDARATNVRYIEAGSGIAWAPAILTAINFLGFYGVLILVIYKGLPDTGARELVSGMIGAVVGSYLASNNFFFGSSQGSANKDHILKQIATQAGTPTVGQMAGKVLDAAVKTAGKR